jgi:hypothetical protein
VSPICNAKANKARGVIGDDLHRRQEKTAQLLLG